jgi:1-deoxy-D-xylulose-5-phosphate synthase
VTVILEKINSPEDLKALTYAQLDQLAQELRDEIIKTISLNGGHLASSLGVVELTIAIHRIFHSPEDKLIWDVGHQSYAHKLLTGRKKGFSTIRQLGGLSGFPSRLESPHDAFTVGHAGTSISAALGMALARDLKKSNNHVIAVIGDGSLGTGMAFEAINHTGHLGTRLIVILNDNGMAISPTLGAVSRILNQVRIDLRYERAKNRAKRLLRLLPFGANAWNLGRTAKKGFARVILPNAFWEQLGFIYLGPFNGHDIRDIEAALSRARNYETRPVIIHVLTTKGKGFAAAENNATKFHGISPKVVVHENGVSSYSQVFGQTIQRLMRDDKRIVAISAAMIEGTGLADAALEFPERVYDVGICEQHAVTLAAGLATQGFVPVVAIYSTFLQRAYDQIIHDVCLQNLPVVLAIDRAGIVGEDGATHQGVFDLSYLRSLPNMHIAAPKDEDELQHLLYTAVKAGKPMAVRYPRGQVTGTPLKTDMQLIPLGKWEVLEQGADLTVVAIGSTVYPAWQAVKELAKENLACTLVNGRFAKPLDAELLTRLTSGTKKLLTIEDNVLYGGFGSAILEYLNLSHKNDVKTECLGLPDCFIEHGNSSVLRARYGLDATGIIRCINNSFPELFIQKAIRP